jgi:hypothetical protein
MSQKQKKYPSFAIVLAKLGYVVVGDRLSSSQATGCDQRHFFLRPHLDTALVRFEQKGIAVEFDLGSLSSWQCDRLSQSILLKPRWLQHRKNNLVRLSSVTSFFP